MAAAAAAAHAAAAALAAQTFAAQTAADAAKPVVAGVTTKTCTTAGGSHNLGEALYRRGFDQPYKIHSVFGGVYATSGANIDPLMHG
jgi:hypothetical protein